MSVFCTDLYNDTRMNTPKRQCIFHRVSPCRDYVSDLICNYHLGMFSLINKVVNYQNGDNDQWTKIVLYHVSPGNLNIPLFSTSDHKILMEEIRNFVRGVCTNYPGINAYELEQSIAKYMGMSAVYTQSHCITGWLDDTSVRLIIRNPNSVSAQYLSTVPYLHKVIFAHAQASNVINSTSGSQIYRIPNISLSTNEMNNSFMFQVINKKTILRYTDKPDSVATPIVLDAFRSIRQSNDDIVITPLMNMQDNCYLE